VTTVVVLLGKEVNYEYFKTEVRFRLYSVFPRPQYLFLLLFQPSNLFQLNLLTVFRH